MKKLYCYLESKSGGYDVFEYTQSGNLKFYKHYQNKGEAVDAINRLSV